MERKRVMPFTTCKKKSTYLRRTLLDHATLPQEPALLALIRKTAIFSHGLIM